ncbi:uncharacterized protein ARMOST_12245 [Armillaria ostoyae]|uniref:Uncharacterized protein n=1 Tax=Armillaria ostoyae TaxID=47428 RepID=A0A284RJE8_ARMOS|nr:uncharacterized protein ARMOST_12245 [Armillaria ostoyae]
MPSRCLCLSRSVREDMYVVQLTRWWSRANVELDQTHYLQLQIIAWRLTASQNFLQLVETTANLLLSRDQRRLPVICTMETS